MPIDERDYMRGDRDGRLRFPDVTPSRPWWRRLRVQHWLGVAALAIGVASSAVWLARDARGLFGPSRPTEGSLVVNVNTASAAELETLPGIGPALARLIIEGRPYESVEDLEEVRGIGPGLVESLRPLVTVEGETGRRR